MLLNFCFKSRFHRSGYSAICQHIKNLDGVKNFSSKIGSQFDDRGRQEDPGKRPSSAADPSPSLVVTGSLSGAKDACKIVPPYSQRRLPPLNQSPPPLPDRFMQSAGKNNNSPGSKLKNDSFARLLVSGPDATGIVASFSQILFSHGCGIIDSTSESSAPDDEQIPGSPDTRVFFQRILFDYSSMKSKRGLIEQEIRDTCQNFGMNSELSWGDRRQKVAIFVSKYDHCLWELLLRHRAGELSCDIDIIFSNHENLRPVADTFGVPYLVFPISKENKLEQEKHQIELLHDRNIDLVVLARYMQVLSPSFCNTFPNRIINIHHSFLPAFMGGSPYHRAHERGVKLIGATAHYTTVDLDEGPIIEQDIMRVTHRDDVKDLIRKGRTLEKNVLVSAVNAHLDDRIIVHKNKCIVFGE